MAGGVFDQILDEHSGLIARIVATVESNPATCEDLKQEAVIALWRAAPNWRGDCTLRTFVARVTHNVCVSHVRREVRSPKQAELRSSLPSSHAAPDEALARAQLTRNLMAAIASLSPGLRETATLFLEGFSGQEIAQTLGINEGTVATRVNRAKAALREAMVKR